MGADDTDFVLEVLRDLMEEANRVRAAIHAAIKQKRAFEVAQHAHLLKSAAAVVGAQELSGICRSISTNFSIFWAMPVRPLGHPRRGLF